MSIANEDLKWLGIDFDKFIAENTGHPDYKPLGIKLGALEFMKRLEADGWKLIIHTARPWSDYEIIENWLLFYTVPYRRIVCGKLLVKFYLDDRNVPYGSWDEMYNFIKHAK